MSEIQSKTEHMDVGRRKFIKHGLGYAALAAFSADWGLIYDQVSRHFRDPSVQARPESIPPSEPVYHVVRPETDKHELVSTLFDSQDDFSLTTLIIAGSTDIHQLQRNFEQSVFRRFAATVSIGGSNLVQAWSDYASSEAERITGVPLSSLPEDLKKIEAVYGVPDLESAKFAAVKTCEYIAPIPLEIVKKASIAECAYVAGLKLTNPLFEKTINNGAAGPSFGGMIVDCLNNEGTTRLSVGRQWLHQFCFFVDYLTSKTPTTYNDIEMAGLMPGLEQVSQDRLNYPDKDDSEVFSITSTKVDRIREILSGELILPEDAMFGSDVQKQQELMLRRMLATFEGIPTNYFEDLTNYVRTNDGRLPVVGGLVQD